MLSQEELDKLLEEGGAEENAAGKTEDAGADISDSKADAEASETGSREGQETGAGSSETSTGDDAAGDDVDWSDAFEEAAKGGDSAAAKALNETGTGEERPRTQEPEFNDFAKSPSPQSPEKPTANLDFIMDLPLEVSVELGRAKMQIRKLLQLGQGSVVELNKMAGEPAEIYVNSKLMARGEVVVLNEKFGVRLTEIISLADRVRSLG